MMDIRRFHTEGSPVSDSMYMSRLYIEMDVEGLFGVQASAKRGISIPFAGGLYRKTGIETGFHVQARHVHHPDETRLVHHPGKTMSQPYFG